MNIDLNKVVAAIAKYSGWNSLVELSKKKTFRSHHGISVYEVISFLFKEMQRDDIMQRAASVSFSLFVSLFPTILVVFTLIPFIPIPAFQRTVLTIMQQVMPGNVYELLQSTIEDIVLRARGDLLSISLILAIYYSTRGVVGMMNSFDKALPTFRKRTFWQTQGVAFKITGLLTLLLLFSIGLIMGGEFVVRWVMKLFMVERDDDVYFWLTIFRWVIIVFVYYLSISLIYFYGPARHTRWQFFSSGSTLATILLIIVALLYSWLINQFGDANKLYGSIGTLLVTQLFIYYNALGLLIGFELNASIEVNENILLASKAAEPPVTDKN